jgi:hypothetical protein
MNDNDEARRLINDALGDAYKNAPQLDTLNDLIANVAAQLWADDDARGKLAKQGPHADLLTVAFHELGHANPERPGLMRGGVMVSSLARIDAVNSQLLPLLTTPKTPHAAAAGYAIANYVAPDNEPPALLLIVALVNNEGENALLWALANDHHNKADHLDLDGHPHSDLRQTALALLAATQRKAAQ